MSLLEIRGLTAAYGHVQALFGVDLQVGAGEVVALMGRNGMGKTTTIRCVTRMMRPSGGTAQFAGRDLISLKSQQVARLGVGLVPEGRRCFPNLTVAENLAVAARRGPWTRDRVEALFPPLADRRDQMAATLSGGEQQMLAIGRALMTNPRLLILDEATEGLAPVIRAQIWQAIERIKGVDLAILLVDKSLAEMRAVMDRAVILEKGQSVWQGAPPDITEEIAGRYLGL
jgi:branched-chain amino acid transport system ATP-binding protein